MYVWTEYSKNELIARPLPLVQDGLTEIVKQLLSDCESIIKNKSNDDIESLHEIKQFCDDFMVDPKSYTQKLFNHFQLYPVIIDLKYHNISIKIGKYSNNRLEITASSNVNEPWQVRITYLNG